MHAHQELLMNWFKARGEVSSGVVEGLNNKIQVVTRRSHGFRIYDAMDFVIALTREHITSFNVLSFRLNSDLKILES
jgi:hypothetical protein